MTPAAVDALNILQELFHVTLVAVDGYVLLFPVIEVESPVTLSPTVTSLKLKDMEAVSVEQDESE